MVMAEQSTGRTGAEAGDAGDVHTLFGLGHGAAEDDVVDLFRIERGDAGESALDRGRREVVGARWWRGLPCRICRLGCGPRLR